MSGRDYIISALAFGTVHGPPFAGSPASVFGLHGDRTLASVWIRDFA